MHLNLGCSIACFSRTPTHPKLVDSDAAMQNISNYKLQSKISLFIIVFHKGKYINEKKDRVMVMHIENFTKLLYGVFPTG